VPRQAGRSPICEHSDFLPKRTFRRILSLYFQQFKL
jgi:hypothetical protein